MEQFESDGYQNLSLADKSTIHTAAATLGMLGYNLQKKEEVYNAIASENGNAGMTALGQHLWQLVDGNTANGEVNDLINPAVPFPNNYDRDTMLPTFTASLLQNSTSKLSAMPMVWAAIRMS